MGTLKGSAVHVLRFLVSVAPIVWAFAMFGQLLLQTARNSDLLTFCKQTGVMNFGPYSSYFATLNATLLTLFSLLNADDISDIFASIADVCLLC